MSGDAAANGFEELCEKTEENLKVDDDTPEQSRTVTEQSAPSQKKPSKAQKRRVSVILM